MCCLAAGGALQLSDLQLLNYDAVVTQEVLRPLSRLRSLSIYHLYSVPGPICHLQTWLTSLPQLRSLSVHGESDIYRTPAIIVIIIFMIINFYYYYYTIIAVIIF